MKEFKQLIFTVGKSLEKPTKTPKKLPETPEGVLIIANLRDKKTQKLKRMVVGFYAPFPQATVDLNPQH